jgi:hypothetical protein
MFILSTSINHFSDTIRIFTSFSFLLSQQLIIVQFKKLLIILNLIIIEIWLLLTLRRINLCWHIVEKVLVLCFLLLLKLICKTTLRIVLRYKVVALKWGTISTIFKVLLIFITLYLLIFITISSYLVLIPVLLLLLHHRCKMDLLFLQRVVICYSLILNWLLWLLLLLRLCRIDLVSAYCSFKIYALKSTLLKT